MAITIDQFLQDLTERQLLSLEEAHAVRRRMTSPLAECAATRTGTERREPGTIPAEVSTSVAHPARLILCGSVIKDKLQADENSLVFNALRLSDESPVTIHVLVPGQKPESPVPSARQNGSAFAGKEPASRSLGIVDVGRHGEVVCVCCKPLDGETLEQLVSQNGTLPLELATETLLQTARTLKRLQDQGLCIGEISPDVLLLDEDGRVHLMGQHLARIERSTLCHCSGDSSANRLHQSLGQLYAYLQTARVWNADSSSEMNLPSEGTSAPMLLHRSAKRVFSRLMGREVESHYPGWEELLLDLESMLRGQELSMPIVAMESQPPVKGPESAASIATPIGEDSSKPQSQKAIWWVIGLAIAAAAAVSAISLLSD